MNQVKTKQILESYTYGDVGKVFKESGIAKEPEIVNESYKEECDSSNHESPNQIQFNNTKQSFDEVS